MAVEDQPYPIIPEPHIVRSLPGSFGLNRRIAFTAGDGTSDALDLLRGELKAADDGHGEGGVVLSVEPDPNRPEGYALTITPDLIRLVGSDAAGVLYGVQTIRQLIAAQTDRPRMSLPCLHIEDAPGLRWRGLMLDVARHFMPVGFIRRLIDFLAYYKLNVLHLHLTDDQGWRFDVPGYPRLTEVGSWRAETLVGHHKAPGGRRYDGVMHGGFYREHELREIVAYASRRAVTVVPEIDMPGHVQAALAAYPELGSGAATEVATRWGVSTRILHPGQKTLRFCQDVLTYVLDVFPGEFIHCGGDEASIEEWERNPQTRSRVVELGLADTRALHHWFNCQLAGFLADRGRRYVGWDEIMDCGPLPLGAAVMAWRGGERGVAAARAGGDVITSPRSHVYLDYYQGDAGSEPLAYGGYTPLERVYEFEPVPPYLGDATSRILGAEAQLWTEYIPTPSHAEYMLFPRLCAFAEAVWRPDASTRQGYLEFIGRLRPHLNTLAALGVNHRPVTSP